VTNSTVKPTDVKLSYACGSTTDTYAVPLAAGSASSVPATGWLAYPGQPYAASGSLTVCADYNPSGNTYYKGTATTVANTSTTGNNNVPTITISGTGTSSKC
jgi:hypothetical protein